MSVVNGSKFHTEAWNEGMTTYNCELCAKEAWEDEIENYFYRILKDIVEIEYSEEPIKKYVLSNYHWFDNTANNGIRVHKDFDIVDIRHT